MSSIWEVEALVPSLGPLLLPEAGTQPWMEQVHLQLVLVKLICRQQLLHLSLTFRHKLHP